MNKKYMKILWLCLALLSGLCSCRSEKEKRRILVVHSYEESYVAYQDFNRLIEAQFIKEKINPDIRVLYLDCESYDAVVELTQMQELLDSVSRDWKPEVILVNEDQATYSLLKCGHSLVKEVPIVFGGVNYPNWELIKQYPNVTGFHDKIDCVENVCAVRTLLGQDTHLFTVLDSTYLDRQLMQDAKRQFKNHKVIGFMQPYLSLEKKKELMEEKGYVYFASVSVRGSKKDGNSALLWSLSKYFRNQCYVQMKRDFTTVNFGNFCASPSVTTINEAFGYGEKLLGGYFTTLPIQVKEEVGSAVQILNGVHPSDIPVVESRKEHVVDWEVMQKLKMPIDNIPTNYTIINIPFREEHPILWLTIMVAIIIVVLFVISCLLWLYLREERRKKGALSALASEKETLALAIEGGTTYIWRLDEEFFVFEDAFWESLNMHPKRLAFSELIDYVHPDHWEGVQLSWKDLMKANKKITQLRCNFNERGYQWWEFRYTTKLLPNGTYKTAGLILNVQSIKNREEELEAARLLAEKAELKQSFLANMSHEIRTPLNSIVGFSNILAVEEELTTEERQEYIDTINNNSELLLKLINDILELSRMESGYMSFSYEKCMVRDLINDVYMTHQVLIMPRLNFLKEVEDVQLEINVDKDRLTQVLTNFLNNASKFTESGAIKLGFYHLPEEEKVAIYVEDTGRGIPCEEQKIIFSRFYKRNEFSQGAGLGLSICQVIISKLGGIIELDSEFGKGSRFTLILPCRLIR